MRRILPQIGSITILGRELKEGNYWASFNPCGERIVHGDLFDFILIEADGAKEETHKGYGFT